MNHFLTLNKFNSLADYHSHQMEHSSSNLEHFDSLETLLLPLYFFH